MHQDHSFEPLSAAEGGPSMVVRHDSTVLRPVQPWTSTIHALLRHLESVGFTGAPRAVGDGRPVAFIDWTLAGPTDRRDEIAATAWWNAQLHDDKQLPDAAVRAAKLRHFLDGYALSAAERVGLVTHMIEFAIRDCAWEAIRAQVTPESTDPKPVWARAWRARAAAWILQHRPMLEQAIEP